MSVLTSFLKLFKYQSSDDASTFNLDVSLNDNWDKIDEAVSKLDTGKADTNHTHTAADVGADPAGADIDCGGFGDGPVAAHNVDAQAHAGLSVDGNDGGAVTTDATLEEHASNTRAHTNILLDGNTN